MLSVLYNNNYQFVQTEGHFDGPGRDGARHAHRPDLRTAATARASHKPNVIKPWLGDSVGWWEGDTLVIETININPMQSEENSFPLSPRGVVTEKLTRTSEKDIFYEFTVNDPENYTQPWKAELSFYPQPRSTNTPATKAITASSACWRARGRRAAEG